MPYAFTQHVWVLLLNKFIREGIEPDNEYLAESKRRLTMDKPKYKDRYYNVAVKGWESGR